MTLLLIINKKWLILEKIIINMKMNIKIIKKNNKNNNYLNTKTKIQKLTKKMQIFMNFNNYINKMI